MNNSTENNVPRNLRRWFVIHFVADILFAIPLLLIPETILPFFGWTVVDPITSRLVGAALLGIGTESLLGRNASLADRGRHRFCGRGLQGHAQPQSALGDRCAAGDHIGDHPGRPCYGLVVFGDFWRLHACLVVLLVKAPVTLPKPSSFRCV